MNTSEHGDTNVGSVLGDYYRCPDEYTKVRPEYGLPFSLTEVVDNLRLERYVGDLGPSRSSTDPTSFSRRAYHFVRPLLPVAVRKRLQRIALKGWDQLPFPAWPVACHVEDLLEEALRLVIRSHSTSAVPFIWFWPDGHDACLILTHDVETAAGRDYCGPLMDVDESFGLRASFQLVPEKRYAVSQAFTETIRRRGFEVNVHGLCHDGRLFDSRQIFVERAPRINAYKHEFGAAGFRSPVMYRNVDWYDLLDFEYDMSVPNVAHLDPQPGGCCTVMPYFIGRILELPLTMTQDYALFHILGDRTIELWKKQAATILDRHGLLSVLVHPDYVISSRYMAVYRALLTFLVDLSQTRDIWRALPGEVNTWWRQRAQMRIVRSESGWRVEGPGHERARMAYATLHDGRISYHAVAPVPMSYRIEPCA